MPIPKAAAAKKAQSVSSQIRLRAHRPGDIGWVVSRHGALYAQEFGWDGSFEAMVARIGADFIDKFQPGLERAWIAEIDGQRVGAVFIVRKSKTVAKLRMLLIDPEARGLGLGKRLVNECISFARAAGYRKITLWTHDILLAARGIYLAAGFRLVSSEPNHAFGKTMHTEVWERRL
jgi:GNAT superfamily N-acetyltransferase